MTVEERLGIAAGAPLCTSGRRPFRGEAEVRQALGIVRGSRAAGVEGYKPGSTESRYYQCEVCHWWHMTSSTGRARRSTHHSAQHGRRRR